MADGGQLSRVETEFSTHADSDEGEASPKTLQARPVSSNRAKDEREKRTYRACLHVRRRTAATNSEGLDVPTHTLKHWLTSFRHI